MGAVWVAHHHGLGTDVAVKVIHDKWSADDPEFRARFSREAMTAARLDIPQVPRTLDCGEMPDGRPYIVMELLQGEDLLDLLEREGPLPLSQVADILTQVGAVLDRAHKLGIIHRDVKPDNLFICDRNDDGVRMVKLLDFGIAKHVELPKMGKATTPGRLIGTPDYLPPERVRGDMEATTADDLWALAVVAYYMVSGVLPFAGAKHLGALCAAVMKGEIEPPSTKRPGLPAALDAWFERALHVEPFERMKSGAELAATFEVAIGRRSRAPQPLRRAALIAAALVVVAGVIYVATRDRGVPPAVSNSAASAPPAAGPCPGGMKPVAGGKFGMAERDVTVAPFCLDVYEVTVARYTACVDEGRCKTADKRPAFPKHASRSEAEHETHLDQYAALCNWGRSGRQDHPINCIDWFRADVFCRANGARLPSEAEWENAARGTDGRTYPWGNDEGDHQFMNAAGLEWARWLEQHGLPKPDSLMYQADDGHAGTSKVGLYPRAMTQGGHMDMVGNVWEWTEDWFADGRKVIRGGGFNGERAMWLRPSSRYHQDATASVHAIGFRCAADRVKDRQTP